MNLDYSYFVREIFKKLPNLNLQQQKYWLTLQKQLLEEWKRSLIER